MKQDPPRPPPATPRSARARPVGRRAATVDGAGKSNNRTRREEVGKEETKVKDSGEAAMKERVEASERLVVALRAEMAVLKELTERMRSLNKELELQNEEYQRELSAAHAKIRSLELEAATAPSSQEEKMNKEESKKIESKDVICHNEAIQEKSSLELHSATPISRSPQEALENSAPPPALVSYPPQHCANVRPPPPPPPPTLRRCHSKTVAVQKAPSLVEFYHSLTKRDREKTLSASVSCGGVVDSKAHTSIVGEIQNRSAHLLAIKADVETKGDFINFLIEKVHSATYSDIQDLSSFVDWLDNKLSTLADERAVLKHFNWPEKKADAMREAAMEYRALKQLEKEVHLFQDDSCLSFESALKKMAILLEKLERSTQRLIKLRDVTMHTYREAKIPTDWILDSGVISKIKVASMKLAKVCMRRVSTELESFQYYERGTIQETMLLQCIRFAYRVHQFAGGFDMEAMSVFEELRWRVCSPDRGSHKLPPHIAVL